MAFEINVKMRMNQIRPEILRNIAKLGYTVRDFWRGQRFDSFKDSEVFCKYLVL